ncbi:hypothetical protein DBR06_SOUSAS110046, partial [Sousa chinensis]
AWVPEKPGRVSASFLSPACSFPVRCAPCVQRDDVLMKSLE